MDTDNSQLVTLADEIRTVRSKRLGLNKEAAELEATEKALKYQLQKLMEEGKLSTFSAVGFTVTKDSVEEPFAADWSKLIQYIKDTGSVDILQKRLTMSAIRARIEQEGAVPGIEFSTKVTITVE